jgi:hypothetical protein
MHNIDINLYITLLELGLPNVNAAACDLKYHINPSISKVIFYFSSNANSGGGVTLSSRP